jgi:hypothetical protein
MPNKLAEPLAELIERIERRYEDIFEQFPAGVEDVNGSSDEHFQERARGFKKAADLVAQSIIQNYNLLHYEMLPAAVFLYRHSMELNLKSMRTRLATRVSRDFQFGRIHQLAELWSPIERYLESGGIQFVDGQLHYRVARAVKEVSDIDLNGQLFRYPDSNAPAAFNWIRINLENLRLSATEVDLLAFGFSELVSFVENVKSDASSENGK